MIHDLNGDDVTGEKVHAALAGRSDTQAVIAATRRLVDGESYSVADLRQVGHPIIYVSPAFERLTGFGADAAMGRNLGFLQRNDTEQEGNDALRGALRSGVPANVVLRNYRQDGSLFWNEQRHYPIKDAGGRVTHLLTVQRDVSEQVHAGAAQEVGDALADSLEGDGGFFAYALLLRDGRGVDDAAELVWVSEASRAVTGYDPRELVEAGLERLVHGDDHGLLRERMTGLRRQERRSDQYRIVTKGGRVVWVEDFAARRWDSREAGVTAVYGILRDVSAARRQGADMWHLAHFDALTGLPNRHLLEDRIQQAIFQARRGKTALALAVIDLDNFRFVNETLSHRHGDRLIQEVATRLRRALRRTDTLARWGGDSFALLIANLPQPRAALPVLDKILGVVSEPFQDGGTTMRLSASVGVELYPTGARNATELVEHAQHALQHAKEREKGGFRFFEATFDDEMRKRSALEGELRHAIVEDQLVLHYQPRVELQSGAISSVEALVRWVHPTRGLLKPAEFIPLAEEAQLGSMLFEWVLERACRQAKRWQQQRTPRRVAVNVSPQALELDEFTDSVQRALSRYDLHPGLLEIEINERTAAATLDASTQRLREIRGMGVHVALDDFGVAYSSLTQLRALPLDGLKIDRSFVEKLGGRERDGDTELIRAIIALGKSLKLRVTAEGIETREQNTVLRTLQCDEGQGFLFSQAVPAEYVPAFA